MNVRYFRRQKGIALITALLVVALAMISATAMISRQQIDIRRTSNVLNLDQAYLYALGAEEWARRILIRDRNNSKIDHLSEDWAIRLPPTMVEGGGVSGHLQDLQGRFNLNNLVENGKAVPAEIKRFQRLLAALDLPVELAQAVTDWIDADSDSQSPDGAEDDAYWRQTPPYRTGNAFMRSPSELRLAAGVDNDMYLRILPYVSALPARTRINVNTAPVPVLMSLAEGLSEAQAAELAETGMEKGFNSVDDFLRHKALARARARARAEAEAEAEAGLEADKDALTVSSDYFLLNAQAHIGRRQMGLISMLYRNGRQVFVIMRARDRVPG